MGLQLDSRSSSIDPGSIDEELDEEYQDATFLSLSPTAMDGFARPSPPRVRTKLTFEGATLAPPTSPTLMRSTSLPTPSASEMPVSPVKRAPRQASQAFKRIGHVDDVRFQRAQATLVRRGLSVA